MAEAGRPVSPRRGVRLGGPLAAALKACRRHFVATFLFSALVNLLYLAPTIYMLQVYDRVVPTRGVLTLVMLTAVVIGALTTLSLLDMVRSRLLVRASMRLDRRLSGAVLDATLSRQGAQMLTKQALRELDGLRQTLTGVGLLAVCDAPWSPIYILVCFIIHPILGLLALVGAGLLIAITLRNEHATRRPIQMANEAANRTYVSQDSSAMSSDVLRALGMRQAAVRRHLREREGMIALQTQASFAASGYVTLTKFARLILQSLALGAGAVLAVEDKISPGAIFAASFLITRALAPIEQILGAWKNLTQARVAYRMLTDLFAQQEAEPVRTLLPPPTGALKVEGLTVLNPSGDGPILANIEIDVAAGQIVGIIGPSGAGKSTLVRMIAGAGKPDRGVVRLDGANRTDWDPELLGRAIGYLPQDTALFAASIKANICRFAVVSDETDAEVDAAVIDAAKRAGAHEMILHLSKGYDTELQHGGRGLSAGQAQRVAMARALYGNPKLVILDEPNAHLDAEGENKLLETLAELKQAGCTVLIVAHRAGVLAALDKILFLKDGRVELFGPRDAVLQRLGAPGQPRPAPSPEMHPAPKIESEGIG